MKSNSDENISPNRNNNGGHFALANYEQKKRSVDYEFHQSNLFDKRKKCIKGINSYNENFLTI